MKSTATTRPARARKESSSRPLDDILRECESVSAQLRAAADELAACWTALGIEISNGASPTELLRRRAWCNVLELRLREKQSLLEVSRNELDRAWRQVLAKARAHQHAHTGEADKIAESLFAQSWALLLQPKMKPQKTVSASTR